MQIKTILAPQRTQHGVQGGSKKRVLEQLAQTIAQDLGSLDARDLLRSLIARERLGSTGIGHGIAIPHCRVKHCTATTGALITLRTPIEYDAIDGKPVDILFALLVPEEANDEHLQTLASLAGAFSEPSYRQALRQASNSQMLYNSALDIPSS